MTEHTTNPDFNPSGYIAVDGIKAATENIIKYIEDNAPAGWRKTKALQDYEQAAMWAVKSFFS